MRLKITQYHDKLPYYHECEIVALTDEEKQATRFWAGYPLLVTCLTSSVETDKELVGKTIDIPADRISPYIHTAVIAEWEVVDDSD